MQGALMRTSMYHVAPFTGAWIEITFIIMKSTNPVNVAPFTGAWIEILIFGSTARLAIGRTLHGCVD